jgi:Ca-activated chloride channel family protein
VSDGIETCDYDPCEVARKLEAAGIDFTAHVIGFDVNEEEAKKQLSCLAEGTGGKFMTASNASALKDSLDQAVKEIQLSKKDNVEFVAVLTPGGEPLTDVAWRVKHAEKSANADAAYGRGPTPKYSLEPGTYIAMVHSIGGKASAEKTIEVIEGETARHEVVLAQEGVIKLTAVNEPGGKVLSGVSWNVFEVGNGLEKGKSVAYGRGAQPEYTLLPGRYLAEVHSVNGKATAEQQIEVIAGKKQTAEVVLAQEGIIQLLAVNKPGEEPLEAVSWNVFELGGDSERGKSVAYGRGAQPEYTLLPGKYLAEVRSVQGKARAEQQIEVLAGKKSTAEVVLSQEGVIKLIAVNKAGEAPLEAVSWNVFMMSNEGEKGKNVAYGRGAQPEYTLLPGKYLAKVASVKGKAQAEQEIEVAAGEKRIAEVVLAQEGVVKLVAVNEPKGQAVSEVAWSVATLGNDMEKGKDVAYGKGAQPEYTLLPGKYVATVKSFNGQAEAQQEIEVVAGKKTQIEVLLAAEGVVELAAVTKEGATPLQGVAWEIETVVESDSMDKPERVAYGKGSKPSYRLLPGKYLAKVKSLKGMATAQQVIEVLPLKKSRVEVLFPEEGEVELSAVTDQGGAPDRISWEIYSIVESDSMEKPKLVRYGGGKTPRYRMLPGRYLARATYSNEKFEKEIEVLPGKVARETLTLESEKQAG